MTKTILIVDDDIDTLQLVGTMLEQKNYEISLKQSEESLKNYVKKIPVAIIETNTAGFILKTNPEAENIFGYTESELKNTQVSNLFINTDTIGNPICSAGKTEREIKTKTLYKKNVYSECHKTEENNLLSEVYSWFNFLDK